MAKEKGLDEEALKRDWQRRGFSFGIWVDPPGRRWEDYVHPTDELLVVLEGEVEVEIEGQRKRPCPGEEVFIPKGARHSVRNVGHIPSRWAYGYRE